MNKLLKATAASALLSTSALYGQIEITENLSVTGFLDMSSTYTDSELSDTTTLSLDQAEIDFLFNFDSVIGQVDINDVGGDFAVEQAFITYDLGAGSSVTAGKFLSYHGWETAEPTGLYQFSYAYDLVASIPGYNNGVSYDYSADWGAFGVSLLDSVYQNDGLLSGSADDIYEHGGEAKLVLTPAEGLTLYFGYAIDSSSVASIEDTQLVNFWTSYETGVHTFAFEYNTYEQANFGFAGIDWDIDADQWLLMYSAAMSDTGTLTARISAEDADAGAGATMANLETQKLTLSWIEALTDNLALVFEVSEVNRDAVVDGDALNTMDLLNLGEPGFIDSTEFAVEALFTF